MKKEDFIRKVNKLKLLILKDKKISISILSGIFCVAVVTTVIAVGFNTQTSSPVHTEKVQTSGIADTSREDKSKEQSQLETESTSSHNDKKLNASDSESTQKETVSDSLSGNQPSKQSDTGKNNYVASTSPKAENNHAEEEQPINPSSPSISNPSSPSVSETTPSQAEPAPEPEPDSQPEPSQPKPSFDGATVIHEVVRQVSSFMTHIDVAEFGGSNYYIDHYSTDLTEDQIIAKLVSGYQFEHSTGSTYFAIEYLGISTEYSGQPRRVFKCYRA